MAKLKKIQEEVTASTPTGEKQSIIEPQIRVAGDTKPHKYEKILNSNKVIKAVGYEKLPGVNEYISYIYHIKGSEVIKVEVGEPNLRAICSDEAKINFVQSFENLDFEDEA